MPPIFVSHATADDSAVTRIHNDLESAGISVWVDHCDGIGPGDNWSQQIQTALVECEAGLFILSPHSAASPECEAEYRFILSKLNKPLFVALIAPVEAQQFPWRLNTIQYVDLHTDFSSGMRALIAAMKGEALPPDAPVKILRPITGHIDRRLTTIPMTGRDDDLNAVKRLLKLAPAAILGMGGLGKSRLAAELALTSPDVDGAVWHTAGDISRPDEVIELLRDHFNLEITADRPAVLKKLRSSKRLIILDNAESVPADDPRRAAYVKLVDDLADAGSQVLLTSRVEWPDLFRCGVHTPRTLMPDFAAKVVLDMGESLRVQTDLNSHAAAIAKESRFHPRLIEWAVGLMKKFPVAKVLADLTDLKSKGAQDALDEMILKTLRQMTEAHGEQPANTLKRLNVCRGGFTYAAAKAIASPPLYEVERGLGGEVSSDLDDALSTLQTYRFITFDGNRYTIDPLVIAAVGEDPAAHTPHYDYYKALANNHRKKQDYLGLDPESANLESAFEWAFATRDGEDALWLANACGIFSQNRGRFAQKLDWSKRVADKLAEHPDKMLWANAQNSLGIDYRNHPLGSRRENLQRAIESYQAALQYYTPAAAPLDYAMTQNNLGAAYQTLAEIEDLVNNLRRAIESYQAALEYRTPAAAPLSYAMTQNNLGTAYNDLAAIEDRVNNLRRAIESYQAALEYYTPSAAPLAYATTQNNLGTAYSDLAALEDRGANLRRAIVSYQAALEYRTPSAAPLDYAMTQNNLGTAYWDLSKIEDHAANLQRAIACYQAALKYRTPILAPLSYANTQLNLGLTYEDLDDLNAAIACWREAEIYYRQMEAFEDADKMLRWIAAAEAKLKG
ncbi:MAG: toll/interleukin-1 receptor domain-containing protein [Anaerolineae bacterium]|nr:toll/interleukin-1 receptor domain-containing protein [Anaerolineae bacterium]